MVQEKLPTMLEQESFIQASICLLTLKKSQTVFIVDNVVCPPGN